MTLNSSNFVVVNSLDASVTRFYASSSFHESVSPQPQSIPLILFRIFSKIRGDIRSLRFATGGKWKVDFG
jgi:hypothetical protein